MASAKMIICVLGMLLFGSYNTLNLKWQFQTCAPTLPPAGTGKDNQCPDGQQTFNKPWSQNFLMFIGEFSLLAVYKVQKWQKQRRLRAEGRLSRTTEAPGPRFYIFAIPSFCDVLGSGLGGVALLFLDAAVWQMMRGAIVIFTAVFTVSFLKRKLLPYRWVSVGITFFGLVSVGTSAVLDSKGSSSHSNGQAALGLVLVLCAQVLNAFQMVFEEKLLTGQQVSAKKTVGLEGFWGCIAMGFLLVIFNAIPGGDHGSFESNADMVHMVTGSSTLMYLLGSFMLSIAMYNWLGLTVSKRLSAVTRCLVDTSRTMVVWVVQLSLGWMGSTTYGEHLKPHSWLQVVGFVFVVVGTMGYNSVIRFPGLRYETPTFERSGSNLDDGGVPMCSPRLAPTKGFDESDLSPPCTPAMASDEEPHFMRLSGSRDFDQLLEGRQNENNIS